MQRPNVEWPNVEWPNAEMPDGRLPAVTFALALLIGVVSLLALNGCHGQEAFTARNVVLVSLDSLGADQVGCYGNPRAHTPGLDRLARQGSAFRDAITPSVDTDLAHTCLLSGFDGTNPDLHNTMLAEACRDTGWQTAAFFGRRELGQSDPLRAGFDTFEVVPSAAGTVERALEWTQRLNNDAAFLLFTQLGTHANPDSETSPRDHATLTDRELILFTRGLELSGHLHRTMILVTSDHAGISNRVDDAAIRVPLIGWGPFPFRGGIPRFDLARSMDITPTALDALRIGTIANRPGRPLQKRLKPYKEVALQAYAEVDVDGDPGGLVRTLRVGPWKYVQGTQEQLFDLRTDPGEQHNLIDQKPMRAEQLRQALREKLGES